MIKKLFLTYIAACVLMYMPTYATCNSVNATYLQSGMGNMTCDNTAGWTWDSYNYAKVRLANGGEANMFTPALDLTGAETVTISFSHAHKFGTNVTEEFTLWVTDNYMGSYSSSSWRQLTINPYAANTNWTFVDVAINVPVTYVGTNTVFCFRYTSTAEHNGTWEVKNLRVQSTCSNSNDPPVSLPAIGNGQLKICAQNLQNYYYNLNSGRGNYTPDEFVDKTRKIVDAMIWINADIYAFCEVEAQPIVLQQLADSANARVEGNPYSAVADGISETWSSSADYNIKSGFIYRNDKVRPVGSNVPVYNSNYYRNTMRVQAFEELISGERLTVSMNHFKAKDSSDDAGESTRITNATRLAQNIQSLALDPDILILGDLNCEVGETPLNIIENAGFEEQLLKYNTNPYSHCYGGGELIDHVYANASMAEQITGAGLFHISTNCGADASANYGHRYSDHDPYVVGVNLVSLASTDCEEVQYDYLPLNGTGLGEMRAISMSGSYNWQYDNRYGAKCTDKGGQDWLLTPAYDLSQAGTVTLNFDHTIGYANTMSTEQTLWVTGDFEDVVNSQWTQLLIPTYPTGKNWNFVNATVNVPLSTVGANTVFGFKYDVPDNATNSPTWEIKNLSVVITCDDAISALDEVSEQRHATKLLQDGNLYIVLPDGKRYNVLGVGVQ